MLSIELLKTSSWECVHFATAAEISAVRREIVPPQFAVFDCDGKIIRSDLELFASISSAMSFPGYFGKNWDAFEECISDMSWRNAGGYLLILENSQMLWSTAALVGGRLVSTWLSAAQQWSEESIPFHLVFEVSDLRA